jgi:probable F420-dependent oxidoreductase
LRSERRDLDAARAAQKRQGRLMKFWQNISWAEADQLVEIAKFAEEVGFHGVMNSEHVFLSHNTQSKYPYTQDGKMNHALDYDYPDVWSSFAAMAAVTTRLYFSSSVYLLPLRSPFEVAKQAGTCALISNNRVTIGFGVGWQKEEFDAMGVDFHTRGKRTDEMIEVMRKLWAGGIVSHRGEIFDFDQVEMAPRPTQPVPFYCGGKSPAAFRRAAALCEGYIGPGHAIDDVPALLAELTRLRYEAGRENEPFETIVPVLPVDLSRGAETYQRLADMGATATFLPPFDVGGLDRGRSDGLGRSSSLDAKKRIMEQRAETILRKVV